MGVGVLSESTLLNNTFTVNEYPGDKVVSGAYYQWYHSDILYEVTPNTILYYIDTYKGQSATPVYNSNNIIAGVHSAGVTIKDTEIGLYNIEKRITSSSLSLIRTGQTQIINKLY
ncbi:hypothetical protein [Alkalihalobacillus pseudalcaliphilus]|uniref:hypothetical protein n=1 Tax=Alkalihalobacillus pseudalcaliphilus TaxID=79884 RepID=UPI00064DEEC5|nr:hypothetical protein [Alkalihalobacillus pseudalcaliphilus]KMK78046.1 hypothetical protein AB990_00915 [Alkalihalobacillus pseudalcaliphilus]